MKLKKVLGLGSWVLGLLSIITQLSTINSLGQGTPLASTSFTRGLLRATNSASFRDALGFLTTNNTVITNYVGNGASITNLNADELRSGTVPLARLSGITASQIANDTLTTGKVDSVFYQLLTNTASGGSGDVTAAGLAAGSYAIDGAPVTNLAVGVVTNTFYGRNTALISRDGKYIRAGAWEIIPGLGSVDLQTITDGATTNLLSIDCLYSTIAGGFGNTITNSTLDTAFGNAFIGAGYNNQLVNPQTSVIVGGSANYAGPLDSFTAADNSTACFIGAGADNRLYDGHESAIVAGSGNTNGSTGGIIGAGSYNYMWASTDSIIGAGERNRITNSAYSGIISGSRNVIKDSAASFAIGNSNLVNANFAISIGNNVTNTEANSVKIGFATNAVAILSNGNTVSKNFVGGAVGLTNFTTLVSASGAMTFDTSTIYTNGTKTAFTQSSWILTCITGVGDSAALGLQIDQDGNGSFEEQENIWSLNDATESVTINITDILKPGARYKFVEGVAGFGSISFSAGRNKEF